MEPNILDLREQRCPLALLLAKRATAALLPNESLTILIADPASLRDIEQYMAQQPVQCQRTQKHDHCSLMVSKETSFNV
ncbi:sulfurtransferase TusA family protein [Vibrio metoecus]|uniref:UPF0033 domain-containing protein n=1 Tax=Vibrio metoecus TaxID=1481663 RepID=A0A271VST7_VIBMT|nr:sulfurtransferase TusA family protein [Vibrio metoecus]KQB09041.1 hypothetical protein XV94_09955 [Vibrio metoecus]PAR21027.1 hypothetical protein CGU03_09670 [Vibrio metoecus]PAR26061.1 hypothetical protein CGU02_00130 [Vibrio metoecus]